jgi:hypothetical protein
MESMVGFPISNIMMYVEKVLERCQSRVWRHQLALKILSVIIENIMALLLNDHVVHDHASSHDLRHYCGHNPSGAYYGHNTGAA